MKKTKYTIHLKLTENAIIHEGINAFEKGQFYNIQLDEKTFVKYPIRDIWRITECWINGEQVQEYPVK